LVEGGVVSELHVKVVTVKMVSLEIQLVDVSNKKNAVVDYLTIEE
jgi:hypothetical protein